ncbi:hypothetical protein L208DRAFT_1243269, partial [Tricholoma matsutake]
VPTFGQDMICKFSNNASAMKKLAAWDFEDLLQCAMAIFEGLMPDQHNNIILDLLFELMTWHSLAKLQLHTESTLQALDSSTTQLSSILQQFQSVMCAAYMTHELTSEEVAREWRKLHQLQNKGLTAMRPNLKANQCKFNLATYKTHSLGDYIKAIQMYGTTDSYSTQLVSTPQKFTVMTHNDLG